MPRGRDVLGVALFTVAVTATIPATIVVFGGPDHSAGLDSLVFMGGLFLVVCGTAGNCLPPPDDRFDAYAAEYRWTVLRMSPGAWRVGLLLTAVSLVTRFW